MLVIKHFGGAAKMSASTYVSFWGIHYERLQRLSYKKIHILGEVSQSVP